MSIKKNYEESRAWGEALRRRRITKNYTQEVVAIKSGISGRALCSYERRLSLPDVITALKILNALDWTLEDWAKSAEEIEMDGSWYSERFDWRFGHPDNLMGDGNDKA